MRPRDSAVKARKVNCCTLGLRAGRESRGMGDVDTPALPLAVEEATARCPARADSTPSLPRFFSRATTASRASKSCRTAAKAGGRVDEGGALGAGGAAAVTLVGRGHKLPVD